MKVDYHIYLFSEDRGGIPGLSMLEIGHTDTATDSEGLGTSLYLQLSGPDLGKPPLTHSSANVAAAEMQDIDTRSLAYSTVSRSKLCGLSSRLFIKEIPPK